MAPTPPTILSLKQSFLTTQTRLLSQPLTPSRGWRTHNAGPDNEASLPEKAIDDALFKLNHRLQQHFRRVYAPQATRHVAEQIDKLYWNAATQAEEGEGDEGEAGEEGLRAGADLADPAVITTLPLEWDSPHTSFSDPLETKRYAELSAELHTLAERKQQAAARVARLRQMKALLEPFSPASASNEGGDDGGGLKGVQENLVTRNGEIEKELSRMRMLLARVGGRVGRLKEQGSGGEGSEEVGDVEMEGQRKVAVLLDRF
ncbi:hypothetical protein VTI74DRAFT_1825 [Chaetomium olivicolor]